MTIHLLSDLHSRADWLRWASAQRCALTAISGDVLDGFHPAGLLPQMVAFKRWADAFPHPLAISSGNHDGNLEGGAISGALSPIINRAAALDILRYEHWMDAIDRPGVVSDRHSRLVEISSEKIVVTTIPFFPGKQGPGVCKRLWHEAARQRAASGAQWLLLHHEPPGGTLVGGYSGDSSLFYRIREYQPDFVLSGHIHAQPYFGSFADRVGKTWCFNPGVPPAEQMRRAKIPNHIVLDTEKRSATWYATPALGKIPIRRTVHLT